MTSALFSILVAITCSMAFAQEPHSTVLRPFMTDDIVGVFYVNLEELDLDATIQAAAKLGFQEQDEFMDLTEATPGFKVAISRLKQAGISRAYGLLRASDVQSMGTSWVFPLKKGSNSETARSVFAGVVKSARPELFAEVEVTENTVLASATKKQMERLRKKHDGTSKLRKPMWDALGNGAVGIVLFGDSDTRRVVNELLPSLPVPFEAITGELLAKDLNWGGVELTLGKTPNAKIVIDAFNEQAAKTVQSSFSNCLNFLRQLPQTKSYLPASEFGFVFESLNPVRDGSRVTVSTRRLSAEMDRLAGVLAPQVKLLRVETTKTEKLNQLRQLALANHNFESAFSRFPTQATVDKNGKPMLSWRVQILPFIGRNDLYQKFHLDEPWDSEHNRKLIAQMPEPFKDPHPLSHNNNKAGNTIYQGVAGEGMMFNGAQEIRFKDITDGSSNTILIVAVAREHAVPWTKPTDWQVDSNDPTALLREPNRTEVEFAIADGSTRRISISTESKTWNQLIQKADGSAVEWPK